VTIGLFTEKHSKKPNNADKGEEGEKPRNESITEITLEK
jgi:hypothetical protein